jgi:hypothetical protein
LAYSQNLSGFVIESGAFGTDTDRDGLAHPLQFGRCRELSIMKKHTSSDRREKAVWAGEGRRGYQQRSAWTSLLLGLGLLLLASLILATGGGPGELLTGVAEPGSRLSLALGQFAG